MHACHNQRVETVYQKKALSALSKSREIGRSRRSRLQISLLLLPLTRLILAMPACLLESNHKIDGLLVVLGHVDISLCCNCSRPISQRNQLTGR
ncbi:hypothetical protein BDV30DRAFT_211113 [Aspergillus minisclerotigenes]|uniref:Uncharacterized protein n=1 Tax=Aspergillus minisclerotigenes TaxID=656917 RepID=A0A5N6J470_9EURO|nr:hypothetical protein BDV30DRAFT_211113 [Aspergillus minisclerotigenes]